eukprot:scaffold10.g2375.t1
MKRFFTGQSQARAEPGGYLGSPTVRASLDSDSRSGDGGYSSPAVQVSRDGAARAGLTERDHRLRQSGGGAAGALDRPAWSLADDVLQERFQAALSHTEGAWQPITGLTLSLEPAAVLPAATLQPPAAAGAGGEGGAGAAGAAGWQDPWQAALLGVYAQHAEGAGRTGGRAPRPRLLFQYKPYSLQEPLVLSEAEVSAVVEAVFGKMGAGPAAFREESASLWDSLAAAGAFGVGPACSTGAPREVAAVILIKLIMDLYLKAGPRAAFPLALMLLQKPLLGGSAAVKARVFDMLFNLSVHGELLYTPAAQEAASQEAQAEAEARGGGALPGGLFEGEACEPGPGAAAANADWRATVTSAFRATLAATMRRAAAATGAAQAAQGLTPSGTVAAAGGRTNSRRAGVGAVDWSEGVGSPLPGGGRGGGAAAANGGAEPEWPPLAGRRPAPLASPATERFQQWLRLLLFRLMAVLAALPDAPELAWVSALSCLVHLTTYEGRVVRAYVEDLPPGAVAALLEQCRAGRWSEQLQAWLITLGANLLYSLPSGAGGDDDAGSQRGGFHRQGSAPDSVRGSVNHHRSSSLAAGGGGGGGYPPAPPPAAGEPAWWAAARLDHQRLADFGGMAQVLRCYREAPTQAARRCMFAATYDYVTSGQAPTGPDAWAPVLQHRAHASEVAALGAALLRMGAAEAAHPLFVAGTATPGGMQARAQQLRPPAALLIAAEVSTQMAGLQAANPGRVVSVPPALVAECADCLEEICARSSQVPPALEEAVQYSLDAVADQGGGVPVPPLGAPADDAAVWECLAGCLRDPSDLGARIGGGWLLRLLVAAAERALLAGGGGGCGPPLALLPEVRPGGGCHLAPGARGLGGQERLRELLTRVLATTPDSRAPESFIAAVGSLLAHVRLRAQLAALEREQELGSGAPGAVRRALNAAAAPPGGGGGGAPRGGGGSSSGGGSPLEDPGSGGSEGYETSAVWLALDTPAVVIATLSLAVEWLLQAPEVVRQGAMLHAAKLLLTFLTAAPPPPAPPPCLPASGSAGRLGPSEWGGGGAAPGDGAPSRQSSPDRLRVQQQQQQQQAFGRGEGAWGEVPPPTPAQLIVAASTPLSWRATAQHSRPGTAAPSALSPPAATAAGSASPTPTLGGAGTAGAQRPATPGVGPGSVYADAGLATRASGGCSADGSGGGGMSPGAGGDGDAGAEAATAAAEGTLLWSFLAGLSGVPMELLRLVSPVLLLRAARAAEGWHASAGRLTKALDAALGVKGTAQAGRPLYDARAAVLLLLMGRVLDDPEALSQLDEACARGGGGGGGGWPAFFAGLLGEHDVRLRHAAAAFVLRALAPGALRRGLRAVVKRAQQANDEKLLQNPYLQVRAMLDLREIDLQKDLQRQPGLP